MTKVINITISTACLFVTAIFQSGCATSLAHHDASSLREMAIDYYQDQIIDNLVRAKNGQLFMHVNIDNLNAQIQSTLSGTLNGGQSLANTGSRQVTSKVGTIPQIVSSISSVATRPFTFSITPSRQDQIQVNTKPINSDAFVYDMYLRYLSLRVPGPITGNKSITSTNATDVIPDITNSDNILSVMQRKPGEKLVEGGFEGDGAMHYVSGTLHHWHGNDYYIPLAFKQPYFELSVALLGRVITGDVAGGAKSKSGHALSGRKLYIAPSISESPTIKGLEDIKNKIESLPQF